MKKKNQFRGSLLLILCAMLWGFGFAAQDIAAESLSPFTCCATRYSVSALALLGVVTAFDKATKSGRSLFSRKKDPLTKKELFSGILCGVALFAAAITQQTGIDYGSGAGKASFLTAFYVILVPVFGTLFFKKRSSPLIWTAVLLAIVSIGLISLGDDLSFATSDVLLLISALCWCTHITTVDLTSGGCDGIRLSMVQMATCALLNLIAALIFEGIDLSGILSALGALLYLGLFSGATAFTLQILGQKECPSATASIIMSTESLFGVLGGALFVGEVLSARAYIGCGIFFIALILSQLPAILDMKRERAAALAAANVEGKTPDPS